MNVVIKILGKLHRNFKVLFYCLFVSKEQKLRNSKSNFIWNRTIATSCGAYPVYFPRRREITDTFWGNIFLLTRFFVWMSYRDINRKLEKNNSVYVSLNEMGTFMKRVLPKIRVPFVLVTGDSDYSTSRFEEILENEYLIHWFAQHNDIDNKMITTIPACLDFHTLIACPYFREKKKSAARQEKEFSDIIKIKPKKRLKVFMNSHLSCTNERRNELYEILKDNPCIYFQKELMSRSKMWRLQNNYAFNFSPAGNGTDAHRTWESLLLGQVPIVEKTGTPMDDLHRQFPIVIIDDVSEICEENLEKWHEKYSRMLDKKLASKLTNAYWIKLINSKK